MQEVSFGLVAKFYSADETLIPNASYRGDVNQDLTRHSIDCLQMYFDGYLKPSAKQPHPREPEDSSIAQIMAM
ncbi:hypothetical protein QN400_21270 [Pseudomonas sp. RTC3]|uniref:hypothetical protein n=1 Tax=Pseudomonas sp. 5C2 TaxID=3048588 RepID=UPI002AB39AC6|nr:hypothetical protein [Pseudomonas sp. 5C2]MDY7567486.1 hypothetical protein [Pseudomonas sp. 5C2]MEB0064548.1 hypothetical protein [Pseudomonas sp. RTC3]MEB0243044.1 hypothetical protein [Pseudomonas sp. 5C2]